MKRLFFGSSFLFIFSCLSIYCSSSDENSSESAVSDELLVITKQQFENEGMAIGNSITYPFEDLVKVNGYILSPPNGIAQVSTHVSGLISNIYASIGKYVTKGQVLCTLSSKEIISIQQDFAETSGKLNGLKLDYQRANSLINEKISSQKEFIAIESEYKSTLAKYEGLKSQLSLIGINAADTENGKIISSLNLYAPISGYITIQKCIMGQYAEPNQALFEIVDINQLQLQLSVYEKDITKLKIGQPVRFSVQGSKTETYVAELISVGKSIDQELKTIQCLASLKKEDSNKFVNHMFVEAEIIVEKHNGIAVPNEALLKVGDNNFLFIQEKEEKANHYLKAQKVDVGHTSKSFTEIITKDSLYNVVIKGVYNLQVE